MTPEEIEQTVKQAVKEALTEYSIPAKDHYDQHQWLKNLMDFSDNVRSQTISVVVKAFVGLMFMLVVMGFVFWGKKNF